jgi:hypothetical protein
VELVAEHGWKLLSHYCYLKDSGTWVYRGAPLALPVSLDDFDPGLAALTAQPPCQTSLPACIASAEALFSNLEVCEPSNIIELDEQAEALRWFYLPKAG